MIFVTGGAGFIGSNFVHHWLGRTDESVLVFDALTYAGNPENLAPWMTDPRFHFVRGDLNDRILLDSLLSRHRPRAVLHFAAESHVDRSIRTPDAFLRANVMGTFSLLEAIRADWNQRPAPEQAAFRFLQVSTDEVYGSLAPDAPAFTEESPFAPNSPYSASKAASDHWVRAYGRTYGLPVLVSHCSNNYGPYQFPEKLIPLVIHHALEGTPLPLYGDGRQIRDWLYVEDHCHALVRILEGGRVGETYNVGGGCERTNREVMESLCRILDRLSPRPRGSHAEGIVPVPDRPGHDRRYALDAGKIRRELGWEPRESFESGIEKTVRWYLDHSEWVSHVVSGDYRDWIRLHYSPAEQSAPAGS